MKPVTFFEDGQEFTLAELPEPKPELRAPRATHAISREDGLKGEIYDSIFFLHSFEDADGVFYINSPIRLGHKPSFIVSMELTAKMGRHVHPTLRFEVASDEHQRLVKFDTCIAVYSMRKRMFEVQYSKLKHPDRSKHVTEARAQMHAAHHPLLGFGLDTESIELAVALYTRGVFHPRTLLEAVSAVSGTSSKPL